MRKFDSRLWIGGFLVLWGISALLNVMEFIPKGIDIFWGVVWGAIGLYFLRLLFTDQGQWWAAFPGFTSLGLSVSSFLPDSIDAFGGLAFFAGISLAFWWVYFTNASRWWAIIPGGVLLTLGAVSALDNLLKGDTSGGLFFLGLGLTFVLVAILPGGGGRSWALIPGVILLLFGAVLGTPLGGIASYIWPAALIILGGYFVLRFFTNRSTG